MSIPIVNTRKLSVEVPIGRRSEKPNFEMESILGLCCRNSILSVQYCLYSPFVNWLSLRWASLLDGHLQLVRTVQMVSVLTELTEDIV